MLSGGVGVGVGVAQFSAPAYDVAEVTALAAATVVWEYLALLAARASPPEPGMARSVIGEGTA